MEALHIEKPKTAHFNGIGGFDGDEYVMVMRGETTPLPWCNILAEDDFGCIITESGGGYTWANNSALFKLTPLSNDPVTDAKGEVLTYKDVDTGRVFSPFPDANANTEHIVRHGFGYSVFESGEESLHSKVTVFVSEGVKCWLIELENPLNRQRRIQITFYAKWVLSDSPMNTELLFAGKHDEYLYARSPNGRGTAFVSICPNCAKDYEWTCSEAGFKANGMDKAESGGNDACAAMSVEIELKAGRNATIPVMLGFASDPSRSVRSFEAKRALSKVKQTWQKRLKRIEVQTDDKAFDRMMNGRLLYQVYSSRLLARAGFYQAGGAYGFRDQLQDCLAIIPTDAERVRKHIVNAASKQFEAGDVMHWWHPPARGVRTHISDDMLFLPYVAMEYAKATGDDSIWDEEAPYLEDEPLPADSHDIYFEAKASRKRGTVFEHCIRAINKASHTGRHGLPLMGTGDWNDGMDEVGARGEGESVWLAWFLIRVLDDFSAVCAKRGDEELKKVMLAAAKGFRNAVEKCAWDGEWYVRAFFDDGTPLGGKNGSECTIDAISQAWAVMAEGSRDRAKTAMKSLENRLVDKRSGIIKLLDPPFQNRLPRAGYIQSYLPGVRENGGQYTHAAMWVILAFIELGELNKAAELFSMLNPIRHSDNPIIMNTYKGEPYAVAGDVYSGENAGRAGWTWYTGAAAWMYVVGLKLAGFRMENGKMRQEQGAQSLGKIEITFDKRQIPQKTDATS